MKRRLFGLVSAVVLAATSVPSMAVFAADDQVMDTTSDGYDYEAWNQDFKGQWKMNPGQDGCYTCSWSGIFNFLARMGKRFSEKKSYKQWGDVELDYEVTITPRGNVYMCVYGWTQNPLVEYYIVEGWGSWRPPGGQGGKGSIQMNGKTYDVYSSMRNNQPSIEGYKTFPQYWSVAQSSCMREGTQNKVSGTISVSGHFDEWSKKGLDMSGSLYEVALNMEGYGGDQGNSSADCTITKNALYINGVDPKGRTRTGGTGSTPTPSTTAAPAQPVEPGEGGYYMKDTFENGTGNWSARGTATVAKESSNVCEGSGALAISSRSEEWCGAGVKLDTATYVPGNAYSFNCAVMQNATSSTDFKLSLEYVDSSGSKKYADIAKGTGKSGEWIKLSNTSYTIPAGASDLLLYVETESGTVDFYLDSASIKKDGMSEDINVSGGKSNTDTPPTTTQGGQTVAPPSGGEGGYKAHQNNDYTYTKGGTGFKDIMGPYFRLGTSVSGMEINDRSAQEFIKANYNSITCENEMKPDQIIKGINGSSVNVDIGSASGQLKFAEQNGIGVRGHTFIWHSQTPSGMYQGDKATSDARIDNFIKQTFEQIQSRYPNLKLYAYDVCNEVFKNDGGGLRVRNGGANDTSQWTNIYGENNNGHIIAGFKAARKYAPKTCKLYLNDYNEYMPDKCDDLCNMAKQIMKEGDLIDGIGMQSHLDARYPDKDTYESAIKKFIALGLDVQITELDITNKINDANKQRQLWKDVFTVAMTYSDHISSLTMWGTYDQRSWRANEGGPLLFTGYNQPKAAYNDVIALASQITPAPDTTAAPATTTTTTTTTVTTPAPVVTTEAPSQPKPTMVGDVTCDNVVDVSDAVLLARFLNSDANAKVSDTGRANADADKNGTVEGDDVTQILKYIAKIIDL